MSEKKVTSCGEQTVFWDSCNPSCGEEGGGRGTSRDEKTKTSREAMGANKSGENKWVQQRDAAHEQARSAKEEEKDKTGRKKDQIDRKLGG